LPETGCAHYHPLLATLHRAVASLALREMKSLIPFLPQRFGRRLDGLSTAHGFRSAKPDRTRGARMD
jgi:hypothetical protein